VLAFYRTVVRQTRKQSAAQRGPIAAYARGEFERHRDVNPKDYQLIEHLVRKGKRQLDMLKEGSVTGVEFRTGH
jgi:succinate dehydrogenase assembly factor 1